MNIYKDNIETATLTNSNFRKVLWTGQHCQLVVMSLKAGEEIGAEVHDHVDQFFRVEQGQAKFVIDGQEYILNEDEVTIVPAGAHHNVINTGAGDLKLYTIYSPANHPEGTIHATKADAEAAEHHS